MTAARNRSICDAQRHLFRHGLSPVKLQPILADGVWLGRAHHLSWIALRQRAGTERVLAVAGTAAGDRRPGLAERLTRAGPGLPLLPPDIVSAGPLAEADLPELVVPSAGSVAVVPGPSPGPQPRDRYGPGDRAVPAPSISATSRSRGWPPPRGRAARDLARVVIADTREDPRFAAHREIAAARDLEGVSVFHAATRAEACARMGGAWASSARPTRAAWRRCTWPAAEILGRTEIRELAADRELRGERCRGQPRQTGDGTLQAHSRSLHSPPPGLPTSAGPETSSHWAAADSSATP
jgi:hypothetical protein